MTDIRRETESLIALSLVPGLGPAKTRALVEHLGSASAVFDASTQQLLQVRGVGPKIVEELQRLDRSTCVRDQIRRARRVGARHVPFAGSNYPPLLRETYDPPLVLWLRGQTDVSLKRPIAIVGTRRASPFGRRFAYDLSYSLASGGWTIVSGLAYGIDACAHRGALDAGGSTVAVLGCGVDVVYPAPHRSLFDRIVERGAVLSEFPMGERPEAQNFPRRNRLISGISLGVAVVETFEQGGGLITARFALEQNREVFAVPGSPVSAASEGCNRLIQSGGAKLILNADDVEAELEAYMPADGLRPHPRQGERPGLEVDPLLRTLVAGPLHVDDICESSGLPASEVQARLMMLEIAGTVSRLPGGQFYLTQHDHRGDRPAD